MAERTALHPWHAAVGARFIEFGGWEMPLAYVGIVEEHLAVRRGVGLFDVSHMGKVLVEGPGADTALDGISSIGLPDRAGRARYTFLLREDGTILDDAIVTRLASDRHFVVCNAGPRRDVVAWLEAHCAGGTRIEDRTADFLCLAIQGPRAPELLQRFTSVPLDTLRPFDAALVDFRPPSEMGPSSRTVPPEMKGWGLSPAAGPRREPPVSDGSAAFLATRTGYTGEAGFELFPPAALGRWAWEALLAEGADLGIRPIGLGARDTLRLEKGYLLSGQDFDGRQTPLEVSGERFVRWDRGFAGKEALLAQKARGGYPRLVGLRMEDRGIPRHGHSVLADGRSVGAVTSGTLSPSLRVGIALASVAPPFAAPGGALRVEIRGTAHPARVVVPPFL